MDFVNGSCCGKRFAGQRCEFVGLAAITIAEPLSGINFFGPFKTPGAKLNHSRVDGLDNDEWRRMLQLRLPIAASRTPEQIIKQGMAGISSKARQGSQVTTEAGDKVDTKRQFGSGPCLNVESLAANTGKIHEFAAGS